MTMRFDFNAIAPDAIKAMIAMEMHCKNSGLPARLFHPDYRRTFRFGAVTLQPGMPMTAIQAAFEAMIEDAAVTGATE